MIRPAPRLLLLTAVVALPSLTIAGIVPGLSVWVGAILLLGIAAAAWDANRAKSAIRGWTVTAPPDLRWFQNRQVQFRFQVAHAVDSKASARFYVALPHGVRFDDEPIFVDSSPAECTVDCTPLERANLNVSVCHVEAVSPWRLWRVVEQRTLDTSIRVYPDLRHERAAELLITRSPLGIHHQRQLGKGREFEKLRDYLPGDSFEDIHWKATARRSRPVVKVFQVERTQEVYAVIDSSRLSLRSGILNRYVNAALILALAAEAQGDRFGLASFSATVDRFVPAGAGKLHFGTCRESIYALQARAATPDLSDVFSFLHVRLRKRALIVFLMSLDDPALAETFARDIHVLAGRHLVLVNVPQEREVAPLFTGNSPANDEEVYARLAGHLEWRRIQELRTALHRQGVRLTIADPARLPEQIARQYLDIKQRQIL